MSFLPAEFKSAEWRQRVPVRLILFGAAAMFAFFVGFLHYSALKAGLRLQNLGYYAITGTFLWWLLAIGRLAAAEVVLRRVFSPASIKRHRAAWLLIGGLTAMAVLSVPYSYKILYDELVQQVTAMNMHFFREVATTERGFEVEGVFRSIDIYLDKRPFFYPFIISLIHDFTGFRVLNAFVFNTLLMPVVLGMMYQVSRQFGGRNVGLVGLVGLGASALLAQNANGAGMEMLNLCMILLTVILSVHYLEKPGDERLAGLVLTCVLLAETRYESALYVAPVALVIIEGWRRERRLILPVAAMAGPLLLIPCALHNTYLSGTPVLWELQDNAAARFGATFLAGNLSHAAKFFLNLTPNCLNSIWLTLVGFAAIAWAGWCAARGWRIWRLAPPLHVAVLLIGVGVCVNLGLLMFYYWGQLDDPLVFRLVLPFMALQSLALAWWVGRQSERLRQRLSVWCVFGGLLCYLCLGVPASARNANINQIATEIGWAEDWVTSRPWKSRLIITNASPLNWFMRRIPCLTMQYARGRAAQVKYHVDAGTFSEVLVVQYYRPTGPQGGFILDPLCELPAAYVLEPVAEHLFGSRQVRISRVVKIQEADEVKPTAPKPPPAVNATSGSASDNR